MKNHSLYILNLGLIVLLSSISINVQCAEQNPINCLEQNTIEEFFDDPISDFNRLRSEPKFFITLYYLRNLLQEGIQHDESVNSYKAVIYLESNPKFINYINKKVIDKISAISTFLNEDTNKNLKIYKLIYDTLNKDIKNKEMIKQLPDPNLFNIARNSKKNFNK